ncbi:MAG TPA: hypothetical protein VNB29_04905, partial [Chthoniobacterales bacterium]|nr:hypothetical protein [Chthoniobacterales bacterium]
ENEIIVEICRYLATRAASADEVGTVIDVLGSWGDTLPEEDVLRTLHEINVEVAPIPPVRLDELQPRIFRRRS